MPLDWFSPRASSRRPGPVRFGLGLPATLGFLVLLAGCPPVQKRVPLAPVPMPRAIATVNDNISKIRGTLQAVGSVDGYVTLEDGRRRTYHVDGVLFFLAPSYVRFDLKSFGDRKFLLGSNARRYWYYDKESDTYHCGFHDADDDLSAQLPIPPRHIISALGLAPLPMGSLETGLGRPIQRIVDEYQQILYLQRGEEGLVRLHKEYWLDRSAPRLVRRVIIRDTHGDVEMESSLDDYKVLAPGGPFLPGVMTADWPSTGSQMRFRVRRWRLVESVGPGSVQFAAPRECDQR